MNVSNYNDTVFINSSPIFTGITMYNNSNNVRYFGMIENPLILDENDVLSFKGHIGGFLVNSSNNVQPITINLTNISGNSPQYTVPAEKTFILMNIYNPYEALFLNSVWSIGDDFNASGNYNLKTLKNLWNCL